MAFKTALSSSKLFKYTSSDNKSQTEIPSAFAHFSTVVSVGISLKKNGEEPDWKAHIPYENLDELINALNTAKEQFGNLPK